VRHAPVDEVHRAHTRVERVEHGARLHGHAARDHAALEQRAERRRGQLALQLAVGGDALHVGEEDQLLHAERLRHARRAHGRDHGDVALSEQRLEEAAVHAPQLAHAAEVAPVGPHELPRAQQRRVLARQADRVRVVRVEDRDQLGVDRAREHHLHDA
jgi:hypothetical protein